MHQQKYGALARGLRNVGSPSIYRLIAADQGALKMIVAFRSKWYPRELHRPSPATGFRLFGGDSVRWFRTRVPLFKRVDRVSRPMVVCTSLILGGSRGTFVPRGTVHPLKSSLPQAHRPLGSAAAFLIGLLGRGLMALSACLASSLPQYLSIVRVSRPGCRFAQ